MKSNSLLQYFNKNRKFSQVFNYIWKYSVAMKILMISSEAAPYAKTGGLADAVSALSKTLTELGHDVKILIPRYYGIDRQQLELCKSAVPVSTGFSIISVDFYKDGFTYFVDYEPLFGRDGVYGDKNTPDFYDNPLRFSV